MSDIHLSKLKAYLQSAYRERQDLSVDELVSLNTGWESDVYGFRAAWGAPADREQSDLILRIYPGQDAAEKSAREFEAMRLMQRAGYPVPRVDLLERDASPFGKPFMIMQRVAGKGMWSQMFSGPPEKQQRLLDLFCGLFARLHAVEWRGLLPEGSPFDPGDPRTLVPQTISRWQAYSQSLPASGFSANFQWLVDHQYEVQSERAAPVHWDFHPENVLLDENERAVVIDWTSFELSDYRFDLAWTLLLVGSHEGMQWREPLLRGYERHAGHTVQGLEFFDAACALRRLFSVVASVIYGPEKMGMRPGAEAIMRKQAPALRHVYQLLLERTALPIPEVEQFLTEAGS